MNNLIATEGLVKFFGNICALNGLNLKALKGISGFIGPNGSGKTTTINILLGLLKPDEGKAEVFGLDCWHNSFEIRKRLGVLHEKPTYPGNFTGKRYLEHVAHIYDVSEPEGKANDLLKEVGLSEAGEKAIKTYSAGMIQRLGLAQALIGDPELVLLDEPTANLDPLGRIEFLEKIKQLHKDRGVNFFISTHILPELQKVCSWVSIINEGVIVDQASIDDLATKYSANVYKIEVSNSDLFAERLGQLKTVENVWVEGDTVYCKVNQAEEFYRNVPRLIAELKLQLKGFQPMYGTLEEVFKTLIGNEPE